MSGFQIPNTTPVPNDLINGWMMKLKGSELKVLLLITRKTLGWILDPKTGMRKEEDWLSWRQMKKITGLGSERLSTAIDSLSLKHRLIQIRNSENDVVDTKEKRLLSGRRRLKLYYRLNLQTLQETSEWFHKNPTATEMVAVTATENRTALLPKPKTTKSNVTKVKENIEKKSRQNFQVTPEFLKELQNKYLNINVSLEWEKAWDWIQSMGYEKKYKNWQAFLRNWVRRTDEKTNKSVYADIQFDNPEF